MRWHSHGSSPRMRGTLQERLERYQDERIIPAHAGNSNCSSQVCRSPTGSSPRMRGTRCLVNVTIYDRRIIPAHAGNSEKARASRYRSPDHPRACGELSIAFSINSRWNGSSPRMRGTHHGGPHR